MSARPKVRSPQAGLALIEIVLAVTLIAICATAILAQMSRISATSARAWVQSEARSIAESYLEEIAARPFVDPAGPDGETARRQFDDLDDYDRLLDRGVRDASGVAVAALARFTVAVRVRRSAALPGIAAADTRRITVTVTDPLGGRTVLSTYRTRP